MSTAALVIVACVLPPPFVWAQDWSEALEVSRALTGSGLHDSAAQVGEYALALAEARNGPDDSSVAKVLGLLTGIYYHTGDFERSEACARRGLPIIEAVDGTDGLLVSSLVLHLGQMRLEAADYSQAIAHYRRAIAIREKRLDPDDYMIAQVYGHLALAHRRTGAFDEAEETLQHALGIFEKNPAPLANAIHHHATTLRSLGNLYRTLGRADESLPLLIRAHVMLEELYGPEHWEVGSTLTDLADTHLALGRLIDAEVTGRRALVVTANAFNPNHPWMGVGYRQLAKIHLAMRSDSLARWECEQALTLFRENLGSDHPEVATVLGMLSRLERRVGNSAAAQELAYRAYVIRRKNFVANAMAFREHDALRFAHFLRRAVDELISALDVDRLQELKGERVADVILASKGQVSDGIFALNQALVRESEPRLRALADQLQQAQLRLARHYVSGLRGGSRARRDSLEAWSAEVSRLEAELLAGSESFRRRHVTASPTVVDIAAALPKRSALVEYFKYGQRVDGWSQWRSAYLALVVQADGQARLVSLGPAAPIEASVDAYRTHMIAMTETAGMPEPAQTRAYQAIARTLYEQIWAPIEDALPESELVYVAPDGGLTLVAIGTLIGDGGQFLVESTSLHYLSAGRDLLGSSLLSTRGRGLLAMGAPDYDGPSVESAAHSYQEPPDITSSENRGDVDAWPSCEFFKHLNVPPLPHSRHEVEAIGAIWKERTRTPARVYVGQDASETRFRAEAPGRRAIHLATHGFFVTAQCPEVFDPSFGDPVLTQHPLLLSGLFLAGANRRGMTPDDDPTDDGVLTAYEISALDLTRADLVVLSACETALGTVEEGEGVYGLRRAFQMAGAQAVVTSLWPVSDREAARFMNRLYADPEADVGVRIRELQLARLRDLRSRGLSDHPVSWGGFIASGTGH